MTDPATPIAAIEALPLAVAMRQWLWLYPIVEITHIVGFVTLVGSVAMFDLRVLGLSRSISVTGLARHTLPWTLGALLLIVPTGLMMFTAHATDFIDNRAFVTKMCLLALAGCNGVFFHVGPYQGVDGWDRGQAAPLAARASAGLSLLLWIGVISCGRLLAYV
ncbi:MAG: DUF6644 family protein [Betaproteobacteria bacterium]